MTIREAIHRTDTLIFNSYKQNDKIEWLSRLDSMVKRLIIDTHQGAENTSFSGYTDITPLDTVLLVPAPYDEMYLRFLEAQIHYHNGEYDKYNNAIVLYNTEFEAYQSYYNRTHMPVQSGRRFLF